MMVSALLFVHSFDLRNGRVACMIDFSHSKASRSVVACPQPPLAVLAVFICASRASLALLHSLRLWCPHFECRLVSRHACGTSS
jgi:hypothetical protein